MTRATILAGTALSFVAFAVPAFSVERVIGPTFLPVHEAFKISATETPDSVQIRISAEPGYYLYRSKLSFDVDQGEVKAGRVILPAGVRKSDPYFGEVEVFDYQVDARLPVSNPRQVPFSLKVSFQGCAEKGLCYPPDSQTLQIGSDAGGAAGHPLTWTSIWLALVAGMGLSCHLVALSVLPVAMAALLKGRQCTKGILLRGLAYGLAMASGLAVIAFGVATTSTDKRLMGVLQSPGLLLPLIAGLLILAFQLTRGAPALLERVERPTPFRGSNSLERAVILGFATSLILAPWSPSRLATVLSSMAAGGSTTGGAIQILALELGFAAPLLALCTALTISASRRAGLSPNIKFAVAILVCATGIWVADRLVPSTITQAGIGFLAVYVAARLGALGVTRAKTGIKERIMGVLVLAYGLNAWGGILKSDETLLSPLNFAPSMLEPRVGLPWAVVKNPDQLARALLESKTAGIPTVVQWTSKWCISCQTVDELAQSSRPARAALQGMNLVKVDVSGSSRSTQDLLAQNGIFTLPTVQIYDTDGQERVGFRTLGEATEAELEMLSKNLGKLASEGAR